MLRKHKCTNIGILLQNFFHPIVHDSVVVFEPRVPPSSYNSNLNSRFKTSESQLLL